MDQSISSARPVVTSAQERLDLSNTILTQTDLSKTERVEEPVAVEASRSTIRNFCDSVPTKEPRESALDSVNTASQLVTSRTINSATSTATLIARELDKFDPTLPDEELPPTNSFKTNNINSLEENNSVLVQLAQYMELNAIVSLKPFESSNFCM